MLKKLSVLVGLGVIFLTLAPVLVSPVQAEDPPPVTTVKDIVKILDKLQVYIADIFWIIAVVAVLYSAYLYALSGGSDKKIGAAKDQLIYAAIAIAIALMAYGLPTLIKNILLAK